MFSYKGYTGHLEIDEDAGLLFGRVIDIKDVITFKGNTVEEARQAFEDSVDDYLEFCQELVLQGLNPPPIKQLRLSPCKST